MTHETLTKRANSTAISWKGTVVWFMLVYAAFSVAVLIWPGLYEPSRYATTAFQNIVGFLAYTLGMFLAPAIPACLVALLIARIPRKNRRKPLAPFLAGSLWVIASILAYACYVSNYAHTRSQASSSIVEGSGRSSAGLMHDGAPSQDDATQPVLPGNPDVSAASQIKVIVTSQSAQGVTEQDLDLEFLNALEAWIKERTIANTRKAQVERGLAVRDPAISSEAVYLEADGRKLAVVRLSANNSVNQVWVMGIANNELQRVACTTESPESIPLAFGECGEKVTYVFGVKLGP